MSVTTVSIPRERRVQLDEIADAFGVTGAAETIGEMIRTLGRLGVVTTTLPGVELDRCSDGFTIKVGEGGRACMQFAHAEEFARELLHYIEADQRLPDHVNVDCDFGVGRKGNGVKIMVPIGAPWKMFSRDLARDLVERLEVNISA